LVFRDNVPRAKKVGLGTPKLKKGGKRAGKGTDGPRGGARSRRKRLGQKSDRTARMRQGGQSAAIRGI